MFSGDQLEEIRDRLTVDILGLRQPIRDMPAENLPEAAKIIVDAQTALLALMREQ